MVWEYVNTLGRVNGRGKVFIAYSLVLTLHQASPERKKMFLFLSHRK